MDLFNSGLFSYLPYLFLLGGIVGFGTGAYSVFRFVMFHRHALQAPGVVVDTRLLQANRSFLSFSSGDGDNRYNRYAVVNFQCRQGKEVTATSANSSALFHTDQEVDVYYDPSNPTVAYAGRGIGMLTGKLGMVGGGVVAAIIGTGMLAGGGQFPLMGW